MSIVLA